LLPPRSTLDTKAAEKIQKGKTFVIPACDLQGMHAGRQSLGCRLRRRLQLKIQNEPEWGRKFIQMQKNWTNVKVKYLTPQRSTAGFSFASKSVGPGSITLESGLEI
jgi:hypothetical protein